jgi:UDP-glucuronate 4-epimerase
MRAMLFLVTGAAGFIGSHVAQKLLDRGDEVVGLDNLNDYYDPKLKEARLARLTSRKGFTFVKIDLANRPAMEELFAKHRFPRVIHLAAQAGVRYSITHPYAYIEANIVGFQHVLEGCRHNGCELFAHTYSNLFGLPTTGLRFFTVYGPWGRPDMALFLFAKNILEGKPIDVFNRGHHTRDFTYVDDIAEGVIRAADQPTVRDATWRSDEPDPATSSAPWRVFNIGNGNPVPLLRYIDVLEQELGKKAEMNLLPLQPGDVPDTSADVQALVDAVGYRPDTPVEVGVKRFVEWYRSYYRV